MCLDKALYALKVKLICDFYRPQTKLREGVFTGVCHSVQGGGGVPMGPLPMTHWDMGTYPTPHISYPLLHTLSLYPTPFHIPYPLLLTSGGYHWRTVQTCSLEDIPPLLALISSGDHQNGRYASYWNAILFPVYLIWL